MFNNESGTRGQALVVHRSGLPRIRAKLAGEGGITIAFLGGSITEGAGASAADETSWRALTGRYLQERLGDRLLRCINAGVGGTDSALGAFRLREHVLREGNVDLLFVEFKVNDGEDREESLRGMEGIVRQCRRLSPETDLCFVYAGAEKNFAGLRPFNIAVHEEVAEHYGVPSVDFAAGVYGMIQAGEAEWAALAPDGYHPNDAGHALYARFMREYLDQVLFGGEHQAGKRPNAIPGEPLIDGNYEHAAMLIYEAADYSDDFRIRKLRPGEPLMNWRYSTEHVYADAPNASLTFETQGRGAGMLLFCGPDTGIIEYSVNGGPYVEANPFDDWCLGAYRPVPLMFPPMGRSGSLHIAVRNTGRKDGRSQGTGWRVLKLLAY
ncbi:SGNH/GDSL hydrolase family protein [Paenibacillus macerans]|uniref:SGNH/GDSL hydrolase family protein n=1 Tax=Paenibacillus macerans TaxID=44252 RepID=UPI003D31C2BE